MRMSFVADFGNLERVPRTVIFKLRSHTNHDIMVYIYPFRLLEIWVLKLIIPYFVENAKDFFAYNDSFGKKTKQK